MHDAVQTLDIDPLHELEALHWCILHACPPDGARVVDQDVETSILLYGVVQQILSTSEVARVHGDGGGFITCFAYLALDGIDGRVNGVRIGRKWIDAGGIRDALRCNDDFVWLVMSLEI